MMRTSKLFSYKPLWKLLIDLGLKKKDLCRMAGISPASVTKMGKNGYVTTEVIEKICTALGCGICDIIETVGINEAAGSNHLRK